MDYRSCLKSLVGGAAMMLFIGGVALWGSLNLILTPRFTVEGTIISEGPIASKGCTYSELFTIQFTDNTQRTRTGYMDQCEYSEFTGTPGERVTIDYYAGDPTELVPHNKTPTEVFVAEVCLGLFCVFVLLALLLWWFSRSSRKRSGLSTQVSTLDQTPQM